MSNPQTKQLMSAVNTTTALGERYYAMALPAARSRNDQILAALGMKSWGSRPESVIAANEQVPRSGGRIAGAVLGGVPRVDPEYGVEPPPPAVGGAGPDSPEYTTMGANAGEPAYIAEAFGLQRAGMTDALSLAARGGAQKRVEGGTNAGILTPRDIGAEIARARSSSFLNQSLSKAEQTMNLLGMGMGQAGQVGSAALAASGNELRAASMMPTVAPWGNVLMGALAGGASIYGAGLQSGPWPRGGTS